MNVDVPDSNVTGNGRFAENIMHFARVLRVAGLPVGPGRVIDALEAIQVVGLESRQDLYWTLHACFISHPRQREVFDQAFHVFWRNPRLLERMMSLVLPEFRAPGTDRGVELNQRLADALRPANDDTPQTPPTETVEEEFQATMTWSDREELREMDFESMSSEEMREAERAIARMRLDLHPVPTRRFVLGRGERVDARASLRASMRNPAAGISLVKRHRRTRPPAIVVLCDVSGSMSQYSRMMLHFLHALTSARDRVFSFVFGTRLTNVTRHLCERDVDVALDSVSDAVLDWSGGTRIGQTIRDFNRHWSRRVLAQGAVVLLITDGLDRDTGEGLSAEMMRLHRSCRRLVWLNPLLRYDGFEPKALGAQAMLPYVDDFRSIHNLAAMSDLARVLSQSPADSRAEMAHWQSILTTQQTA